MQAITQAVDTYLASIYQPDAPGAAVVITRNGKPVFRKGYGMANLELGVAVQPEMVFRLGSITKQFTAVAILLLAERGLLRVGDEITKYLPDYPTQGRTITIEHLLTHTSGIKSYTAMPEWLPLIRKDLTPHEIIELFKDQPFDFETGTRWSYNNSGYILLGAIIESVSGKSYTGFIQDEIFDRLGMKSSLYDDPSRIVKGRASGYQNGADGLENCAYLSMTQPYAAGSLASCVDDLAVWNQALAEGKLISKASLEKAWQPYHLPDGTNTHYSYGWVVFEYEGMQVVEHGGGINGFVTFGLAIPAEGLYLALLTNTDNPPENPGWVAFNAAMLALGKPYQAPAAVPVTEQALQNLVGVYQDSLDAASEIFITIEAGQLQMQRSGGEVAKLVARSDDEFGIEKGLTKIVFERDQAGKVTGIRQTVRFGPDSFAIRTEKPLPQPKQEIQLAAEILGRYAGRYELAPGIVIVVRSEAGKLFVRLGGQDELELFPESETRFFLKVVDAQIEFILSDSAQPTELVLHQAKQEHKARKL